VLRTFSPEHFVLASSYLTEERIAPHITNRVLPALLTFNFRELLDQSFAASPPFAPLKTISLAEYEASQMTNHDESIDQATHKRITHELTELPKTHEGIKKLLAQIGEEPPQAEQNFFGNLFANMQKMAVNYFGPALIASHTQKISQKAFQKLWQDDRLIPHMAAQSIKILASSTR